ncbi:MAG TPA: RidA family protein [Dongiaceae bacterium]|jgi:2-iminobutanoate/2-iminopropanoate deaminase
MPAAKPRKEVIGGANTEGLPFSEAIRLGNLVFVSGNVGFDETGKIVRGGVGPETRQTFANIEKVLKEAGCSLADIVKVSVVLADPNDFDGYNAVYRTLFIHEPPARVTIAGTLTIDARLEVDVIAGVGAGRRPARKAKKAVKRPKARR